MQHVVFNNALWIISLWLCHVLFEDTSSIFVLLMKIYDIWCKYHAFEGSISCQFCRCRIFIFSQKMKVLLRSKFSNFVLQIATLSFSTSNCDIWHIVGTVRTWSTRFWCLFVWTKCLFLLLIYFMLLKLNNTVQTKNK